MEIKGGFILVKFYQQIGDDAKGSSKMRIGVRNLESVFWSAALVALISFLGCSPAKAEEVGPPEWLFKSTENYCYRIPTVISRGSKVVVAVERRWGTSRPDGSLNFSGFLPESVQEFSPNKCSDWGYVDVVARRSDDFGKTWQALDIVIPFQRFIKAPYKIALAGNPALVDNGKALILMFVVSRSSGTFNGGICARQERPSRCGEDYNYGIWKVESSDLGKTWSSPVEVALPPKDNGAARVGPGHGIRLSNGDLLMPGYPWLLKSRDGGNVWERAAGAQINELRGDETAIVELAPNKIWATVRPNKKTIADHIKQYPFRITALSNDGGESYHDVFLDQRFKSPRVEAGALKYRDRILVSYPESGLPSTARDPLMEKITDRKNLVVAVGDQNATNWRVCEIDSRNSGYSDIAEIDDGVLLVYEGVANSLLSDDNRQGIVYRSFNDRFLDSCGVAPQQNNGP